MTQTVDSPPRRERIFDDIVGQILVGNIVPGEITSEFRIAQLLPYETSRTPVREALALMVHDGMFEQIPKSGIRLRPPQFAEIDELMALRTDLEVLVVKRLALRDEVDLSEAYSALDDADSAIARRSLTQFGQAELRLHTALATQATMRAAVTAIRSSVARLCMFGIGMELDEASGLAERDARGSILTAISQHDLDESAGALQTALGLTAERARRHSLAPRASIAGPAPIVPDAKSAPAPTARPVSSVPEPVS